MGSNPGATASKRLKEKKRAEKRAVKAEKKELRKNDKGEVIEGSDDPNFDPDIAGIIAGPQPKLDEDEDA